MKGDTFMAKNKNWVDYKELKEKVSLEMVLNHYGIFDQLKPSGQNLTSCCPIHKGSNPRQFSVNLEKNMWNCFGNCKTGGNAIDFVAMMEFGGKDNQHIRKAALMIKNWFLSDSSSPSESSKKPTEKTSRKLVRKENHDSPKTRPINPPLKFELKQLEPAHPFFEERQVFPETVKHFGLGFCNTGRTIPGRIAIPIHNEKGRLVAYCGRAVTKEQIENEGKYKQPSNFHKSGVVYNLHRQPKGQKILILVESFISVWKLHQAGYPNVVALMGSKLSEMQKQLLVNYFSGPGGVMLMFDADASGKRCALECFKGLSDQLFIKNIDISDVAQKPHLLTPEQLKRFL